MRATRTIPIVFVVVSDPVGDGLVTSIAHPGGNVTGFTNGLEESIGGKWIEILREIAPSGHARLRVPAIYPFRFFADDGGLITYGIEVGDVYRRAAAYIDRILRGATPAELPVQAPTKFELVVNLKTAKAIGLTIPESFLARADEVIE